MRKLIFAFLGVGCIGIIAGILSVLKWGIFAIYGEGLDVSRLSFYGLFALQHRGQESSGITSSDGTRIMSYKNMGLVTHLYS